MSVVVELPVGLRLVTGAPQRIQVGPGSLRAVLDQATAEWPALTGRLIGGDGRLNRFVNVYVGSEDVRVLDGLSTEVPDGTVVTLLSAVAGG